MALIDLWKTSPKQLEDKQVEQIIKFAGSGRLRDGSDASSEFREFLSHVPSAFLIRYADHCLTTKFDASGLALQDIINQVGRRLGFKVSDGRYRGSAGQIGFDGLWRSSNGWAIVVEVKTTDAYRLDLNVIANYRRHLIKEQEVAEDHSSILIVVGREDTGDLEAQIRGSRHAWDIRLISVDALQHLMTLKERVEDPQIVRKICDILIPREFTKVDGIIDIVFSAAEDVGETVVPEPESDQPHREKELVSQGFHDSCVARVQSQLHAALVRQSRTTYAAPDGSLALTCIVSKDHDAETSPNTGLAFTRIRETLSPAPGKRSCPSAAARPTQSC